MQNLQFNEVFSLVYFLLVFLLR